jgi:hypothetical protein
MTAVLQENAGHADRMADEHLSCQIQRLERNQWVEEILAAANAMLCT